MGGDDEVPVLGRQVHGKTDDVVLPDRSDDRQQPDGMRIRGRTELVDADPRNVSQAGRRGEYPFTWSPKVRNDINQWIAICRDTCSK